MNSNSDRSCRALPARGSGTLAKNRPSACIGDTHPTDVPCTCHFRPSPTPLTPNAIALPLRERGRGWQVHRAQCPLSLWNRAGAGIASP
jgi:hypothetical protein